MLPDSTITSLNSHADVHDAGAVITLLASRSSRIAKVVGEPSDWASASTSFLISSYCWEWTSGLYWLSRVNSEVLTSKPPTPPFSLTRCQKAVWASVIGTARAAKGPTVRSEMVPR